jgi:O-succinylbenzoate synthase
MEHPPEPMPEGLTEHRLCIGDRMITLLEGPAGWGEVSPLPGYPCDPAMAWRAAIEAASTGWPAPLRDRVSVNALVKVKLRTPDDVAVVAAVRAAVGSAVKLRVDANAAWDLDTATDVLRRLAPYDLELAEQPVATLEELAALRRRVPMPLAADESVRTIDDARRLRTLGAADAVVLKVQPLGGVRAALAIAEAAGVAPIPSSMMETSVGIAAGLALAAALPELPYACGLATASLLPADVTGSPFVPEQGMLRVRRVAADPELLARYREPSPDGPSGASPGASPSQATNASATSSGRSR